MSDSNSRLVYSTETGRIDEPKAAPVRPKGDGVVRIQRQTSGRKGKGVCLITGVDLDDAELTKLAAELKKKCGCGGVFLLNSERCMEKERSPWQNTAKSNPR